MKHLSGPPKYFTCNWASAKQSVIRLEALKPEIAATGHGKPMHGEELKSELARLATHFDELAMPQEGRYVNEPAVTNENGVMYVPPATEKVSAIVKALGVTLAIVSVGLLIFQQVNKRKKPEARLTDTLKFQYN